MSLRVLQTHTRPPASEYPGSSPTPRSLPRDASGRIRESGPLTLVATSFAAPRRNRVEYACRVSLRVLFVCTGNICRSPFAELLARHMVGKRPQQSQPSDWQFASAGIAGLEGWPMDDQMAAELRARGGSAEGFRARRLTGAMAHEADLLLVMSHEHRIFILDEWPDLVRRTWLLGQAARVASQLTAAANDGRGLVSALRANPAPPLSTDGVPDPYRRGSSAAARSAKLIETALRQVFGA